MALDVGCVHCLDADDQQLYAQELGRQMKKSDTLLMWAMDWAPPGASATSPDIIEMTFAPDFKMERFEVSKRHWANSKCYWLVRR